MSGDATDAAPPPLHSVFISYASADRAAARLLRDTLAAAGLEVWLDEEELAGGEAWDAKIRNQIRTCTYFMPVISATTEVRREGYFRREWRLAVERTLDFADDVLFLVPVVIDDTRDAGARVPEKFFTVQWLRTPGGRSTPALEELARRLARGDAVAVSPAPLAPPSAAPENPGKARKSAEPPPFPKFPDYPEHGSRGRFVYDLVIWFGHLMHAFWCHLPRWLRVVAAVVIVFNVIGLFSSRNKEPEPSASRKARQEKSEIPSEVTKALFDVGKEVAREAKGRPTPPALESLVNAAAAGLQGGRTLTVVTFSGEGPGASDYAGEVFKLAYEKMASGPRISLSPIPFSHEPTDLDSLERGARMKSRYVLTGHAKAEEGKIPLFTVRLYDVRQRAFIWTETFDTAVINAQAAAQRIVSEIPGRLRPAPDTPPDAPAAPKDKEEEPPAK